MPEDDDREWISLMRYTEKMAWVGSVITAFALVMVIRAGAYSSAIGVAFGCVLHVIAAIQLRRSRAAHGG